jgi:programmed cell death protein 5
MDYEEAKRQKLEELQRKQLEEQQRIEAEEKIAVAVRSLLSEEAKSRLGNVALVNKGLYLKAAQVILFLQESGRLQGKISDEELKLVLERLSSKREIKIKRR